jgi:hypothetical protein
MRFNKEVLATVACNVAIETGVAFSNEPEMGSLRIPDASLSYVISPG